MLQRKAELAEAAIAIPCMLLAMLVMLNVALAAYTANTAATAANYGARVGALAQRDAQGLAQGGAQLVANEAGLASADYSIAAYAPDYASAGGFSVVVVSWRLPNMYAGLAGFFGAGGGTDFTGQTVATYKKEGW